MTITETEATPDPVLAQIDSAIDSLLRRRQLYLSDCVEIARTSAGLTAIIGEKLIGCEFSTSYGQDLNVQFTGGKAELNKVWGWLRAHGWEPPAHRPEPKEPCYSGWFRRKGTEWKVWLSFSSAVCRRIQTGTKTEIVPTYDVVCDEDVVIEEAGVPPGGEQTSSGPGEEDGPWAEGWAERSSGKGEVTAAESNEDCPF